MNRVRYGFDRSHLVCSCRLRCLRFRRPDARFVAGVLIVAAESARFQAEVVEAMSGGDLAFSELASDSLLAECR